MSKIGKQYEEEEATQPLPNRDTAERRG